MPKGDEKKKAERGNAEGLAVIRMAINMLETRMIERYIGNAGTLNDIVRIARETRKAIEKIKPSMISDCPNHTEHEADCRCCPNI